MVSGNIVTRLRIHMQMNRDFTHVTEKSGDSIITYTSNPSDSLVINMNSPPFKHDFLVSIDTLSEYVQISFFNLIR